MSRRISNNTKNTRGMGKGKGKDYKPYITTSEFNSQGTTSIIKDWKTNRGIHCLSQGEALWYYILRWDDSNIDIREQYPLNKDMTLKISSDNGFKHPGDKNYIMTTDFIVTKEDMSLEAYSIKANRELNKRSLEILCIEKLYWNSMGVPFKLLFKTDVNKILAANIRLVTEFYDLDTVFDKYSAFKHKVAVKEYKIDMEHELITNNDIEKILKVRDERYSIFGR